MRGLRRISDRFEREGRLSNLEVTGLLNLKLYTDMRHKKYPGFQTRVAKNECRKILKAAAIVSRSVEAYFYCLYFK
jgi:hypothetical protein